MGHFASHRVRVAAANPPPAPAPAKQQRGKAIKPGKPLPSAIAQVTGAASASQAAKGVAAGFEADLESLHGLTTEKKVELKRELVTKYRAHAEAVLAGPKTGVNDPVTAWWVLWLWDAGLIEEFITNCKRAEGLGLRSPIPTPLPMFRAWRIIEWTRAEIEAGHSPEPYFGQLFDEVGDYQGNVAAEIFKLKGMLTQAAAEKEADPTKATELFSAAEGFYQEAAKRNEKVGVKTRLADVGASLKKLVTGK
ncbi:MAG TPA: phage terminase small subunit [bacterium]